MRPRSTSATCAGGVVVASTRSAERRRSGSTSARSASTCENSTPSCPYALLARVRRRWTSTDLGAVSSTRWSNGSSTCSSEQPAKNNSRSGGRASNSATSSARRPQRPSARGSLKPSSSASYAAYPRRRNSCTSADLPVPDIPVSSTRIEQDMHRATRRARPRATGRATAPYACQEQPTDSVTGLCALRARQLPQSASSPRVSSPATGRAGSPCRPTRRRGRRSGIGGIDSGRAQRALRRRWRLSPDPPIGWLGDVRSGARRLGGGARAVVGSCESVVGGSLALRAEALWGVGGQR